MYYFLIILVVVALIAIRKPIDMSKIFGGHKFPDIYAIQKEIHQYSGLDKEAYMKYIVSMDLFYDTLDPSYLYKAIGILQDLTPATDYTAEIDRLSVKLGHIAEKYVMENSIKNGIRFTPRYLNNIFNDTIDEPNEVW